MTTSVIGLIATACGGATAGPAAVPTTAATGPTTTAAAAPTTAAPAATTGPTTGPGTAIPKVLQVSAPKVGGGGTVSLASYAGRPVALWFWAPT